MAITPKDDAPGDSGRSRRNGCVQSRCFEPLLSTMFQRLLALVPPLPENRTGEASDTEPPAPRPDPKVAIGSRQLSRTALQLAPLVGAVAVAKTPWARLSEP